MATLMSDEQFFSELRKSVLRGLLQTPFHYYQAYDGTVQSGHLITIGIFQQLMMLLEWWPTTPGEGLVIPSEQRKRDHRRLIASRSDAPPR
jgi:hypothetical protein